MKILSIESSCDETGIAILEATGNFPNLEIKILSNVLQTQIELHKEYGGVFPSLAKREHEKNLVPVLIEAINKAKENNLTTFQGSTLKSRSNLEKTGLDFRFLDKNLDLKQNLENNLKDIEKPNIDAIAVTYGPGLEPALWTGLNFAKTLSLLWNIPLIPINHMEGHIFSALLGRKNMAFVNNKVISYELLVISFPAISLLVSGGHTEIILIKDWFNYEIIGETRDDASGEAFDKIARILGLPYPGGPEISKLANLFSGEKTISLPRPMLNSNDLDFSFSGLKTSVLYKVKDLGELSEKQKQEIAHESEEAITDVLSFKLKKAVEKFGAKSIILGGGVSANNRLKEKIENISKDLNIDFHFSEPKFATDNGLMIAISGILRFAKYGEESFEKDVEDLEVNGCLKITNN